MNNEDVRIWKEIHLKTLSWNSSSDTEENHENSHDSDKSIGNLNLEPFKYRPKKVNASSSFWPKVQFKSDQYRIQLCLYPAEAEWTVNPL